MSSTTTSPEFRQSYVVHGMTCAHCVASVSEEVLEIDGVHDVQVDLESGSLTFDAAREIPRDLVRAAVSEAGYELA